MSPNKLHSFFIFKALIVTLCIAIYCNIASAGVNVKNGNYYVTYVDLESSDSSLLNISRTYNSKSVYRGWFGFGWGSFFETRLYTSPDGSLFINENGSGRRLNFTALSGYDSSAAKENLDRLIKIYQGKLGKSVKPANINKLKISLEFRQNNWVQYLHDSYIDEKPFSVGEVWQSSTSADMIVKTETGFIRQQAFEGAQYFDEYGYLIRVEPEDKPTVYIEYYESEPSINKKLPRLIKDSEQRFLAFFYGINSTITQVVTNEKKKVWYEYDSRGALIKSIDAKNAETLFAYDKHFNLLSIINDDGASSEMEYEDETFFVTKVANRYGKVQTFEYGDDGQTPSNHYWTQVTTRSFNDYLNVIKYEFWIGADSVTGRRYTKRKRTSNRNAIVEQYYAANGALLRTIKGDNNTVFEYNDEGQIVSEHSITESKNIEYYPSNNQIKRISTTQKDTGLELWSEFTYNSFNDLASVENSDGQLLQIEYDSSNAGNVSRIQSKEFELSFKYKGDLPILIKLSDVGFMNIEYEDGEMVNITSPTGFVTTMKINSRLQEVLDLVAASGKELKI